MPKPNGLNRAEIQKLLVHSRSRRTGIGHKLIIAAENTAVQLRRGLIYLDTQSGSSAESFIGHRATVMWGRSLTMPALLMVTIIQPQLFQTLVYRGSTTHGHTKLMNHSVKNRKYLNLP